MIGGISEGEDQYHAVTRTVMRSKLGGTPVTVVSVTSLRRIDGHWRLQLGDIRAMVEGLRRTRAAEVQLEDIWQQRLKAGQAESPEAATLEAAQQAVDLLREAEVKTEAEREAGD